MFKCDYIELIGDGITVSGSGPGGFGSGSGGDLSWTAPTTPGTYTLTITVDDTGGPATPPAIGSTDDGSVPLSVSLEVADSNSGVFWDDKTAIECDGITAPTANLAVLPGGQVSCTAAAATDVDERKVNGTPDSPDPLDDCEYRWEASGGTFTANGEGQNVTWTAPSNAGSYTIKLEVNDQDDRNKPPNEEGSRNDGTEDYSVTVRVGGSLEVRASGPHGNFPSLDVLADTNSTPITATLKDLDNIPVAGVTVSFTSSLPAIAPVTATTDVNGDAITTLTIGHFADEVTCQIGAEALGLAANAQVKFTPDIFPGASSKLKDSPGCAGIGSGRTVPIAFTLLNGKEAPPNGAPDQVWNYPPIPNLRLKVYVGTPGPDKYVPDPSFGAVSVTNATTDVNGQILVNYTPPATMPTRTEAIVWLEDRNGTQAATSVETVKLYQPSTLDIEGTATHDLSFDGPTIFYRNEVEEATLKGAVDTAFVEWDAVRDGAGKRHWQLESIASDPRTHNPRGLAAVANYPVTITDRDARQGYAATEVGNAATRNDFKRIKFYLEHLKPKPQFSPIPAAPMDAIMNANAERSFVAPVPTTLYVAITRHELGHVLRLNHTISPNAQGSSQCMGRNVEIGGLFRWFVNGISGISVKDKESALGKYPAFP